MRACARSLLYLKSVHKLQETSEIGLMSVAILAFRCRLAGCLEEALPTVQSEPTVQPLTVSLSTVVSSHFGFCPGRVLGGGISAHSMFVVFRFFVVMGRWVVALVVFVQLRACALTVP